MKNFGKKLIVTSLSTVMGVSMVASVVGTIAWYQFNTRATATVIGTNVSNSGVLQISRTGLDGTWTRDLITSDLIGDRENGSLITPVTFGQFDGALPAHAYKAAEASENAYATHPGSYDEVYEEADAEHDYIQYDVYLRTMEVTDGGMNQISLPVFVSDILMDDVSGHITDGLRIHLAIDEDGDDNIDNYILMSKTAIDNLSLYGLLDLDGDEKADIKGGYEGNDHRDDVVYYGNEGEYQRTVGVDDVKAERVSGNIDPWAVDNIEKIICHTPLTGASKITVTLWLEGWDNVVDDEVIETREIFYSKANYVYADDVTGLYVSDGAGDYELAPAGKAVDGTSYFKIFYQPLELEDFSEIPADTYAYNAGVYNEVVLPAVANPAVDYFKRIVKDVTSDVHFAEVVTGKYTFDGTDYLPITVADQKAVGGTVYYDKVSTGETYEAVVLEDALHNPLPENTVDVSKYYTLSDGNYLHASGMNQDGVTYYKMTSAGTATVPTWTGENTHNAGFRFGLTFDVGRDAFNNK